MPKKQKTQKRKTKKQVLKKIHAKKQVNKVGKATNALFRFFKEAYAELKTVTWLSRKDTVKFSVYILLFILFSALTIALIDLGLYKLMTFITTNS
jgi:preprotein translocase subunit SecE